MNRALRLFVAIYPPAEACGEMLGLLDGRTLPSHRVTDREQVHLTLVFIGDRRASELGDVIESVERSCSGIAPVTLTPSRLFTIPTPAQGGPARLIAIGTDAPGQLPELQRRLATRLARADEKRKAFVPHITLARFAPGQTCEAIDVPVAIPPFVVTQVCLMQSVQTRERAEHRLVHAVQLRG